MSQSGRLIGSSECERCNSQNGLARKDPFGDICLCGGCVEELQPVVDEWMRHRSRISTQRLGEEMRDEMYNTEETASVVENRATNGLRQVRELFTDEELEELDKYTAVVVTVRDR